MPPQLPNEVLTRIAEHLRSITQRTALQPFGTQDLQSQHALAQLARSSRLFRAIATPILYDAPLLLAPDAVSSFAATCQRWTACGLGTDVGELPRIRMLVLKLRLPSEQLVRYHLPSTLAITLVHFSNLTSLSITDHPGRKSILGPLLAPGQPLRSQLQHLRLGSTDPPIHSLQDWIFQVPLFLEVVGMMNVGVKIAAARTWDYFALADVEREDWPSPDSRRIRKHPPLPPLQPFSPLAALVFVDLCFTVSSDRYLCAIFLVGITPSLRVLIIKDHRRAAGYHDSTGAASELLPAMRRSISCLPGNPRPAGTWLIVGDNADEINQVTDTSSMSELELREHGDYVGPELDHLQLTDRIFLGEDW